MLRKALSLRAVEDLCVRMGVDQAILWSSLNRAFGLIKAPLSIFFIVTFLTAADQGLWYTFGSLGALTLFAELGFATIITQFVSHEYALLTETDGRVGGNQVSMERLFGLIRFSLRVYMVIIPIAILILIGVGGLYFRYEAPTVHAAWALFSIVGGLSLLLNLFQSIFQGLNKVKEIQVNAFLTILVGTLCNWGMLALGMGVWALAVGNLLGVAVTGWLLYSKAKTFWAQAYRFQVPTGKYRFLAETGPLQAKYAVSWASGYFIFFLAVPAAYKMAGNVVAGQLGITMAVVLAVNGIANSWITTKIPRFNMLVSTGELTTLTAIWKTATKQALVIQFVLGLGFLATLMAMQAYLPKYGQRFLPLLPTALLLIGQLAQTMIGALAHYLRSFKREPFMFLSILNAVLAIAAVFVVMRLYGFLPYVVAETIILCGILLPLAYIVYRAECRKVAA